MIYDSKAITITNTTNETKLEHVETTILSLITGGVKTIPVTALQLYTGNKTIMKDIIQQAVFTRCVKK